MMQVAIVQSPHSKDPGEIWKLIQGDDDTSYIDQEELDKEAMQTFKRVLSSNPKISVK